MVRDDISNFSNPHRGNLSSLSFLLRMFLWLSTIIDRLFLSKNRLANQDKGWVVQDTFTETTTFSTQYA